MLFSFRKQQILKRLIFFKYESPSKNIFMIKEEQLTPKTKEKLALRKKRLFYHPKFDLVLF